MCNRCHGPLIDHIESESGEIVSARMYILYTMCVCGCDSTENKIEEGERERVSERINATNVK